VTHQIYICELQKILIGQKGRGLLTGCEGHIDVMKYDKFQSLLMNGHTKHEDVMKKIDPWQKGSNYHVLHVGETQIKNNFTLFMWGFGHDKNK
jgi:hypothetical protein